jgi:hypothetical protein
VPHDDDIIVRNIVVQEYWMMEQFLNPILIALVFCAALFGFFKTKTNGFGKHTSGLLVLILVTFVGAFALSIGKIDWPSLSNLLFAIAGFGGGMISDKEQQVK